MDVKNKYGISYFMPPEVTYDWVKKETVTAPPIWCSVDLRDGNQALIEPMTVEEKVEMYKKFQFEDDGMSSSTWGGEQWHQMTRRLK